MVNWLNRTAGVAARNGTTTHTITFSTDGDAPFTPTDGRFLVMIVGAPVTNSWSAGWTEQLQPIASSELSVATITASSTTSVTLTHNASNRPIAYVVYEYPAGTTWVTGASASNTADGAAQPTATLPGAPCEVFYAASRLIATTGGTTQSATWAAGVTENVDSFTDDNGTTDGIWLGVAYQSADTAFTATTTPTITVGSGATGGTERVTFAVALAPLVTVLSGASTALTMSVQVAWGADLTAASSTWTWTDITADVLVDEGNRIAYRVGRSDEAATSQPAQCTLRLDNRTGAYSLGPQASNWPYVKRNTPIRIRVGGDATGTPFQGYVDTWQPDWDQTGRYAVVNVTASGILRRLGQGRNPVLSSIRRSMRDLIGTNLIAYWPMEDNKDAISCASDMTGGAPLVPNSIFVDGVPKFANAAPFACSASIVTMDYSRLDGNIADPGYTHTGKLQMRALVEFPKQGMNQSPLITLVMTDHVANVVERWMLRYDVGGTLALLGLDVGGNELFNTGTVAFDVDGLRLRVGFSLTQSGGNIAYEMHTYAPGATNGSVYTGTFSTVTLGRAESVALIEQANATPVIGHVTVQNDATNIFTDYQQLSAWDGEGALDRITRLCSENSIEATILTNGGSGPAMGAQSVAELPALLRECETADQGILYDGVDAGLYYVARNSMTNQATPSFSLDASAGRVRSIEPVDDDQQLRNRITVTRSGGGSITDSDSASALGTDAVGVYDDSVTVNCQTDSRLPDYAGWLISRGTVEGYRYPTMHVSLRDLTSTLVTAVFAKQLMGLIEITNLSSVRTQLPSGTVQAVPVGWSASLDKFEWLWTYNLGRYDPYKIATPDESDTVHDLRPNTTGSTLAASASAGATSLSVATASGPLWTTAAGDMPMTIEVGDMTVTVSAISGGSSPQTFTVTATTLARASGVTVTLPRSRPVLDLNDEP